MSTDIDLGYLAGMVDGEGCFYSCRTYYDRADGGRTHYRRPKFTLVSVDADALDKCQRVAGGIGRRHTRKVYKDIHTPAGVWQVAKVTDVKKLARMVYPHLSQRRQRKIRELNLVEES